MRPRELRVFCIPCKTDYDCYMEEDFGEAFCCKKCGTACSVNFDKNVIEIDGGKNEHELG